MSNVDKSIKLNFSFIKGDMIGLFCCALVFAVCFAVPALLPLLVVVVIAFLVLLIRIYIKIFHKSIFGDGANLYQAMPLSTEEIIVSKVFVTMIASIISQLGIYIGIMATGTVVLSSFGTENAIRELADAMGTIGCLEIAILVAGSIAGAFETVSLVFALFAVYNTRFKNTGSKIAMVAVYFLIYKVQDLLVPNGTEAIIKNGIYVYEGISILVSIVIGVISCYVVKNCMDKKYVAD